MSINLKSLIVAMVVTAFAFTGCDNNDSAGTNAASTGAPSTGTASAGNNTEATTAQRVDPSVIDNPMTAADNASSNERLPEMTFKEETYNFGTVKQGEVVKHQYKFKNTGKADLIITNASGSCGCTVPQWPKNPIPPGGEANIDVEFNSAGKSGMQRVNVTLIANTIPNSKVLTITGEVTTPN